MTQAGPCAGSRRPRTARSRRAFVAGLAGGVAVALLVLAVGVIGILLTCAVAVLAARVIPDAARSAGDAWWRLTAGGPLSLEEEIRHAYARGEIDAVEFEVRLSRLVERVAERDGERFDPFGPLVLAGRWRFSADGRLVERGPRWGDTDRPPARRRRRRAKAGDNFGMAHRQIDAVAQVIELFGEVDADGAVSFKERIAEAIESGAQNVVVDLTQTTFIDSTTLGVLVCALKRLKPLGGSIVLAGPEPPVAHIFQITGLDRVLAIHRSCDEALAALDDVPTAPARQPGWPGHSTAPRDARARPGW